MAKKAVQKQEKPKRDDEKYGGVLFSLSYEMDDMNYFNASSLVGSNRAQQILPLASMAMLLIIIMSLYDREHPIYPLAIAAAVCFFALAAITTNLTRIRDWYVSKSNLALPGDAARHVVVTTDKIIVEGPGDTVEEFGVSEVKKVSVDDYGALAKLGGRRYVFVPRKALSETRFIALVKHLRSGK